MRSSGRQTRLVDVNSALDCDVVIFQKAYEARHLALAEQLKQSGKRVIFDLCDYHLYNPDQDPNLAERSARLASMLSLADVVTVSTSYLSELLAPLTSMVVPDCLERSPRGCRQVQTVRRIVRRNRSLRIVWAGTTGDPALGWGVSSLHLLREALQTLRTDWDVTLTVLTNDPATARRALEGIGSPVLVRQWRRPTEWLQFCSSDVCVVPVLANEFGYSKTANRVMTSINRGVPVVASPVPSYTEFGAGLLFEDWASNIQRYRSDAALRDEHLRIGRRRALELASDDQIQEAWDDAIQAALNSV